MSMDATSLKDKITRGDCTLVENADGKASCWSIFRLIQGQDGKIVFGWASCSRSRKCYQYKTIGDDGQTRKLGTKNSNEHFAVCSKSKGATPPITAFVKKLPGIRLKDADKDAIKAAEARFIAQTGSSFNLLDNDCFRNLCQELIRIGCQYGYMNVDDVIYGRKTIRNVMSDLVKRVRENIPYYLE